MFCDLVGSTSLSTQLDPEDFRDLVGHYHQHVSREIKRAGGFVAKFLGDGILAYFGYPQATEHDAEHAVRCALALAQGMHTLQVQGSSNLQVRVGIATGTVVVGDLVLEGTAPERAVVGETPNLAARLQTLADPGQVLIGASTRRLLGEIFELRDLGLLNVKGFADPVQAWQVLSERHATSRFEAQRAGTVSRFVGRDSEMAMLHERWDLACDGEGQVVLVSGEAGIGKSRITAALRQRVLQMASEGHTPPLMLLWQCSPLHTGTPWHPVTQQLRQAAQAQPSLETVLLSAGVSPSILESVLTLAGIRGQRSSGLDPAVEKANTLHAVAGAVQALSDKQPVLLLVEDAHWIDPTTEDLLALCVQQLRSHRVMLLVTSRPGYEPSWQQAPNLTRLALSRLAQRQCLQLAQEVAQDVARSVVGHWTLPAALLDQIIKRTDGVPLFVEELTKAVLEAGMPKDLQQGWQGISDSAMAALKIPATLQDSLTARLDRLQPATREVAQAASVIGREFSQVLLRQVLSPMSEQQVAAGLQELRHADLVFLRDVGEPIGTFKHALVRDAAYGSLLKGQRAQWHARVAKALLAVQPQVAEQQPELLAGHYQLAGEYSLALREWHRAGDLAFSRASMMEAVDHYRAALALCEQVGPPVSVQYRLHLQLAVVLNQTQGFGLEEALTASRRALELTAHVDLADQQFTAVRIYCGVLLSRGQISDVLRAVANIGAERVAGASSQDKAHHLWILGNAALHSGNCEQSVANQMQARELIDRTGIAPGSPDWAGLHFKVLNRLWLHRAQLISGRLDQGFATSEETVSLGRTTQYPPTLPLALIEHVRWLHIQDRNAEASALAREALAIAERFQLKPHIASASIQLGRSMVLDGGIETGDQMMRKGVELWLKSWSTLGGTWVLTEPAWTMAAAGHLSSVEHYLSIGERVLRDTEERVGVAELLRLRAWVYRAKGEQDSAVAMLDKALAVAERQGARYFALLAALDLVATADHPDGKRIALEALNRVYQGFSEGLQFPILVSARRLIES